MSDPLWLPQVLRDAGLTVQEADGWRDRGHGDFPGPDGRDIWGVVCHHTGNNNATWQSIAFHPELGLASQLHLDRGGLYTTCGAGVAWHAGSGHWPGLPDNGANQWTIGIEAASDGGGSPGKPHRYDDVWPDAQYNAYITGVAAILRRLARAKNRAIGHKEWAGAAQGKWDPGAIDMNIFRDDAGRIIAAGFGPPPDPVLELITMPTNQEKFDQTWRETSTQQSPSRSFMADSGWNVDTPLGIAWNTDGNSWTLVMTEAYRLNVPYAVKVVEAVAQNGVYKGTYAENNPFLREFGQAYCKGLVAEKARKT